MVVGVVDVVDEDVGVGVELMLGDVEVVGVGSLVGVEDWLAIVASTYC